DREISSVEEIRKTQRKERSKSGIFSFALTGYTNAGKSTILNALTDARVLAEDKLFATLDTTTRSLSLPNGQKVLLSDTVGFIADLPEVLIKAFSSTLEEALSANAIIIVADASHPDAYGCLRKTKETLAELGAIDKVKILVINKTDDIYDEIAYASLLREPYKIVETSMKEGKGIEKLLSAMADVTDEEYTTLTVSAPSSSDIISSLSKDGTIRNIVYSEESVRVTVRIRKELARKYKELK
ncbi:MAG: 50S ribosome-binding GTPase, partial [Spirochaetes bacterium]|nr:50S ribosome-binding GTPase [Candidatus Ornithospirochaeta stercoripullorum]